MAPELGSRRRTFDLRGGGWVVLLAILLSTGVFSWRVIDLLRSRGGHAIGDGKNPATYGFDLSTANVPADEIVASGLPKDGIRAIDAPSVLTVEQVEAMRGYNRLLVSTDRVVGVVAGGRARAYPIRILNWHEVVNDTLGGRAIAVTYSPLCDAVAVFDRRIGGEIVQFGVSGLLYNSDLLMYDRRTEPGRESLWSQLASRAVAGPAAGRTLDLVPVTLLTWADWRNVHPETTVLAPIPGMMDEYRADPYGSYFVATRLRFPVRPLPPADGPPLKTPIVAVRASGSAADGWMVSLASAVPPGEPREAVYAFWFAWYAFHPETGAPPAAPAGAAPTW